MNGVATWRKVTGWILFGFAALAVLLIVATALSHTSSGGPDAATPSDSALASTAQQVAQPVASPTPTGPCLTNGCIAAGMEQSLPGIVDTDGSVLTKASCKAATVKHNANDSYTVTCVASYSDGSQWRGYGTLQNDKVYFQAETEVR